MPVEELSTVLQADIRREDARLSTMPVQSLPLEGSKLSQINVRGGSGYTIIAVADPDPTDALEEIYRDTMQA